jgi:hypothetical protein
VVLGGLLFGHVVVGVSNQLRAQLHHSLHKGECMSPCDDRRLLTVKASTYPDLPHVPTAL